MAYKKRFGGSKLFVILNFTAKSQPYTNFLPSSLVGKAQVLVNVPSWEDEYLGPFEGRVYVYKI